MTDLLSSVVVPVADPDDAERTVAAIAPQLDADGHVHAVHVVAPEADDGTTVEEREAFGREALDRFREAFDGDVETEVRRGDDVADAVFDAAAAVDASAVAFTPRGGSRWRQIVAGDVALDLVNGADRPVVVLPKED